MIWPFRRKPRARLIIDFAGSHTASGDVTKAEQEISVIRAKASVIYGLKLLAVSVRAEHVAIVRTHRTDRLDVIEGLRREIVRTCENSATPVAGVRSIYMEVIG